MKLSYKAIHEIPIKKLTILSKMQMINLLWTILMECLALRQICKG